MISSDEWDRIDRVVKEVHKSLRKNKYQQAIMFLQTDDGIMKLNFSEDDCFDVGFLKQIHHALGSLIEYYEKDNPKEDSAKKDDPPKKGDVVYLKDFRKRKPKLF